MELEVRQTKENEVFKDIVRIHQKHRQRCRGGTIPNGKICKISADLKGSKPKYFIVRGLEDDEAGLIRLDEDSREALGIEEKKKYDFKIKEARWWEQILWACAVADPVPRIAVWLGIWSLILSIVGLSLAVLDSRHVEKWVALYIHPSPLPASPEHDTIKATP